MAGTANANLEAGSEVEERTKKLLECLFAEILNGLKISGTFGVDDAPTIFIVYAHRDKSAGDRDSGAGLVRDLIHYLEAAGCKARSDQNPVLNLTTTRDEDFVASHIILENQFCLLPRRIAINPVNKIVIVASEVLRHFCIDKNGSAYTTALQNRIELCVQELEAKSVANLDVIRELVGSWQGEAGFHHVLTEIAMVRARIAQDHNPESIVPVLLQNQTLKDLPFLPTTQHYHRPRQYTGMVDPLQVQHVLFFNLLQSIYDRKSNIHLILAQMYNVGCRKLATTKQHEYLPLVEFEKNLRAEIYEELSRARLFEPLDVKKPFAEYWFETVQPDSDNEVPRRFLPHPMPTTPLSKRQEGYLRSLFFAEMEVRVLNKQPPVNGSLDWVAQHPSYQRWISERTGMLGVRGKPGSGKSVLLSHIIRHGVQDETDGQEKQLILYFFFSGHGTVLERTRVGMYRALLYQLLRKIPMAGHEFWLWMEEEHAKGNLPAWSTGYEGRNHAFQSRETISQFRRWFLSSLITASCYYKIVMVVDALDEADEADLELQHVTAREVVADLRAINKELGDIHNTNVRICFSCRYYPSIAVDNGLEIRVDEFNREDIRCYVESELSRESIMGNLEENERMKLIENIVNQAHGIFIWAVLACRQCRNSFFSYRNFQETLMEIRRGLPQGLADMYEQILNRDQHDTYPFQIQTLIDWATMAERPLSLEELRYAIACDENYMPTPLNNITSSSGFLANDVEMSKKVEMFTGGLVHVVQVDGQPRLRLIHHSVYEFFRRRADDLPVDIHRPHRFVKQEALWRACRNYIHFESHSWKSLGLEELAKIPFCKYAVDYWFVHAAKAQELEATPECLFQMLGIKPKREPSGVDVPKIYDEDLIARWWRAYSVFHPEVFPTEPGIAEIAKYFNSLVDDK